MQTLISKLHKALPQVREWIHDYLAQHESQAKPVGSSGFDRLEQCYPTDLLSRVSVVRVPVVRFPPLSQFGLPELATIEHMRLDGITYLETFFVKRRLESLYFHELVHVVQWNRLGMDRFLLCYGAGLLRGYRNNPLEQMAYQLQARFLRGERNPELVAEIEQRTDAVWEKAAPLIGGPA